ncbi:MAG: FCD domain-containing protein [Treponema sp.]|jgi:GntR family transcriptional repressor for pyruvate dehydrogenase complex|nr:FCD domain-containing protein [Treponema sp.]
MPIEKIQKQGRAELVFSALRREIMDGAFQAGERLPSAGSMSRQFGVSIATIKAALQHLAALGLIETRVGQGSFVLAFDPNRYLDQMSDFLFTKNDIVQLNEYRLYLEMAIARLAIKKAPEINFERMEQLLRRMDEAAGNRDIEQHGALDYQFHLEIAKATGNSLFVLTYEMIGKLVRRHATFLNDEFFKQSPAGEDVHRRLFRAIKGGDIDACRDCYVEMLYFLEDPPKDGIA